MKMYVKTQNQMNLLRIHRDLKKEIKKTQKIISALSLLIYHTINKQMLWTWSNEKQIFHSFLSLCSSRYFYFIVACLEIFKGRAVVSYRLILFFVCLLFDAFCVFVCGDWCERRLSFQFFNTDTQETFSLKKKQKINISIYLIFLSFFKSEFVCEYLHSYTVLLA